MEAMGLAVCLRRNWKLVLIFSTPLAFSSLLIISGSQTSKCAFMMGICTVYWVTESLPLPVTGLLPAVIAPLLGIITTDQVCKTFFSDLCLMAIGAIFVGNAVEYSNLHRRIALRLLLLIGVQPKRLLFSIVAITSFLSMFIANMVATSMMGPIVHTLLQGQMEARKSLDSSRAKRHNFSNKGGEGDEEEKEDHELLSVSNGDENHEIDFAPNRKSRCIEDSEAPPESADYSESEEWKRITRVFSLAVCYSANIGGIGTLLGTPPNLVLANMVSDLTYDGSSPITYASWLMFGPPVCLLSLAIAFTWMNVTAFGFKSTFLCKSTSTKQEDKLLRKIIVKEYENLGIMTFHEKVVLGHFVVLLTLFITRNPGFVPGWASFFPDKYVKDSTSSLLVAVSLFIWPKHHPQAFWSKNYQDTPESKEAALSWNAASSKFPWGVLFLFGGGMVLAFATKSSGLSAVLVDYLSFVSDLPHWLTVLILSTLTCLITEVASNTIITLITLPILGELATQFGVHPLLYMLPVTAAASMAFMLPVATPPNAIIHAMGMVKMTDMMKSGIPMNILGIISINIVINTVGFWAFDLGTLPSWAIPPDGVISNVTESVNNSALFDVIGNLTIESNEIIM